QAFAAEFVDNVQTSEASARAQRVTDEVHAPALTWPAQRVAHQPRKLTPTPLPAPPDGQPFLSIEPLDALAVHRNAFAPKPVMNEPVPPTRSLGGDGPDPSSQLVLWIANCLIPNRRTRKAREPDCPPLRNTHRGLNLLDDPAPRPGRHYFFPSRSFRTWRFSAWSATSRLSLRFSSSSCWRRRASLTSIPPYL